MLRILRRTFAIKKGEAWYIPFPTEVVNSESQLQLFKPLFDNAAIKWIGQNINNYY